MRTAAILPVKRFTLAKQRLGETVADPLRQELARAMVGDVLSALHECAAIERTIVVTGEPAVAAAAAYLGSLVIADAPEQGQSAAVARGIARALAEGFERALCIPGDCPALDPLETDAFLSTAIASERAVAIVPDRHGTGTNGLLLAPPDAIEPSFGPDSCARHLRLAEEAGLPCRLERMPSLLLDVDTGEDLAALRERLATEPTTRARRTRTVLRAAPGTSRAA
jgi:2-phospho-L-lactate/phosphoenolpyruvate guanylyltransferase